MAWSCSVGCVILVELSVSFFFFSSHLQLASITHAKPPVSSSKISSVTKCALKHVKVSLQIPGFVSIGEDHTGIFFLLRKA
jgi:hypothetical protein